MNNIASDDNTLEIASTAARTIIAGGIVLLAFDTVYGFICDATNKEAVEQIFQLKGRDRKKTIGLAVADAASLDSFAEISFLQKKIIREMVNGAYTFILRARVRQNLSILCMRNGTVGVRMPNSALVKMIAEKAEIPLAQTSANKAGCPNCYSLKEVERQFSKKELGKISIIIDTGEIERVAPSTIIDLTTGVPRVIERG